MSFSFSFLLFVKRRLPPSAHNEQLIKMMEPTLLRLGGRATFYEGGDQFYIHQRSSRALYTASPIIVQTTTDDDDDEEQIDKNLADGAHYDSPSFLFIPFGHGVRPSVITSARR